MDDDERAELISRLFALLTSRFEDSAQLAIDGQCRGREASELQSAANSIWSLSEESLTIAMATAALLAREKGPAG